MRQLPWPCVLYIWHYEVGPTSCKPLAPDGVPRVVLLRVSFTVKYFHLKCKLEQVVFINSSEFLDFIEIIEGYLPGSWRDHYSEKRGLRHMHGILP